MDGSDRLSPLARDAAARRILPCGCGGEGGDCRFWLSGGLASAEVRGGRAEGPTASSSPGRASAGFTCTLCSVNDEKCPKAAGPGCLAMRSCALLKYKRVVRGPRRSLINCIDVLISKN